MAEFPAANTQRARRWLIVSQAVCVASLVPWLMMANSAVVGFDAESDPVAWMSVSLTWVYPLLPITCSIIAWYLLTQGRLRAACITASVPLAVALPLLTYLALVIAGLVVYHPAPAVGF